VTGEVFLLGFLLVLSAFFSSSETAFTSLDRVRLETAVGHPARKHDWALARTYALPLTLWIRLMLPVVAAFDLFGRGLMRLVGGGSAATHLSVGELRTAIAMGLEAGALHEAQSSMLLGALRLRDRPIAEIMVHRTQIAFVAAEESIAEAGRLMRERGVQRLPVYVRDTDEVVGVLRVADVATACLEGRTDATARDVMRDVSFDSELASIAGVLERMQASGDHIVILTDEFGSVAGLVTLEDIVEEVIGQIRSETGGEPAALHDGDGRGEAVIDGRTPLGELGEQIGTPLTYPGVQTIAGLVVRVLGRLPRVGERLRHGEIEITVIDVDARRVKSVAIGRVALRPPRTNGLRDTEFRCVRQSEKEATKSRLQLRSMRKTPPVPAQLPLRPNDVTPATMFVSRRKFGPPESPKHVPPVDALFDSSSEKSPVNPGTLIWFSFGVENIRIRSASMKTGLMR